MSMKIVLLLVAVAAVGAVAMVSALPSAMAQGQSLAPGQTEPNRNPSSGQPPPGQNLVGNPGQCQKTFSEFFGKELGHVICHQ